jgi:predicted GIY-YIG superfamily endonuclease
MANQKQCKGCGETKDTTQFSKCSSTKDKLQPRCKECNKKDNRKFRTEINPTHHQKWQWDNAPKYKEYIKKYRRADKVPVIYSFTNPDGMVYIGATEAYPSVRLLEHRSHYKRAKMGKRVRLTLLHNSFDKHGMDNHHFKIVKECPGLTRKQLLELEKAYITLNKFQNISLNY